MSNDRKERTITRGDSRSSIVGQSEGSQKCESWGKLGIAVRVGSRPDALFFISWTRFLLKGLRKGDTVFSPVVGWLVDFAGFQVVFLSTAGLILLGGYLTFRLDEPRHRVRDGQIGPVGAGGDQ